MSKFKGYGGARPGVGRRRSQELPPAPVPAVPTLSKPVAPPATTSLTFRVVRASAPEVAETLDVPTACSPATKSSLTRSRIRALRPPSVAPRSKSSFVRQRPSLSAQLAQIGESVTDITKGLQQKHGLLPCQPPLLAAPAQSFVVGKLECRVATPVRFFGDKCTYVFNHPYDRKQISMEMRYQDMCQVATGRRSLRFKISHALVEFGRDYDPGNPNHRLIISFSSDTDMRDMRDKVLPKILQQMQR